MKRLFDFIISLIGLIIFSPLLLLLSIAIIALDGFPIIFFQPRLGKNKMQVSMFHLMTI